MDSCKPGMKKIPLDVSFCRIFDFSFDLKNYEIEMLSISSCCSKIFAGMNLKSKGQGKKNESCLARVYEKSSGVRSVGISDFLDFLVDSCTSLQGDTIMILGLRNK